MTTPASHRAQTDYAAGSSVFSRIVVGADGTEPGLEACRQAARLVEPDGWLEVFTAVSLAEAAFTGWSAARVAEELEHEAEAAIEQAREIAGPRASSRLVDGPPAESLLRELEQEQATLVAVGSHGHSRLSEIMLGGVAGELLHDAPSSVLITRRPAAEALFPRALVVGVDGSYEADAALAVAQYLARRFGAALRVLTALKGKDVNLGRAYRRAPQIEDVDEHPVGALVKASRDADILVVGSRGLHGLKALGSVSERVAHEASCSVLVVRTTAHT